MKILAASLCVLCLHCASDSSSVIETGIPKTFPKALAGEYAYTAYDGKGHEIVKGSLTLSVDDSNNISGSWEFSLTDTTATLVGPQVGEGTLIGDIRGEGFGINLNPDMIDCNVILMGHRSGDGLTGVWQFIGFPGVLNEGTFTAVR